MFEEESQSRLRNSVTEGSGSDTEGPLSSPGVFDSDDDEPEPFPSQFEETQTQGPPSPASSDSSVDLLASDDSEPERPESPFIRTDSETEAETESDSDTATGGGTVINDDTMDSPGSKRGTQKMGGGGAPKKPRRRNSDRDSDDDFAGGLGAVTDWSEEKKTPENWAKYWFDKGKDLSFQNDVPTFAKRSRHGAKLLDDRDELITKMTSKMEAPRFITAFKAMVSAKPPFGTKEDANDFYKNFIK